MHGKTKDTGSVIISLVLQQYETLAFCILKKTTNKNKDNEMKL